MQRFLFAGFICVLGSAVAAGSQQSTPPPTHPQPPPTLGAPAPQQTPAFRTRIDLVHLDVSVLDKDRRPVRGLTAKDFTVLENGKPQEVSAFAAVDVPVAPPPTAPWVREVAPDVRTNLDLRERRLFIIAIDDATIQNNAPALKSVKTIARSVLSKFGPSDLVSVVFTRDNRNSQDFTSDRARLTKAIESFTGGFRDQGAGVAGSDDLWYLYSVGMLERAVDYLSDVPERRKAIIYIGQGVPFNFETAASPVNAHPTQTPGAVSSSMQMLRIKDQLLDLFDRAQRANVTVYPIDPCGVRTPPPAKVAGARPTEPPTCEPGDEVDYLVGVANQTGGRSVTNTNDFEPGISSVFEENSAYYLLGYQSADQMRDGKFRKLTVLVNRPDVTIRTRTGYDAPRDAPDGQNRPEPSPLGTALAGVLPKSDLPLQITVAPFALPKGDKDKDKDKDASGTTVAIAVGFRQPFMSTGDRLIENVDLQVAAFNSDGRSFGNTRGQATVTIRPNADGPAEYEVFTTIDLAPGRYQLRLAANVGSLSTAGSVYYDVDVPDFAAMPLSMSGLLLTASPALPFGPKEGLGTIVPIVPTTRRAFGATTHKVSAFARVYQSGASKVAPVTVKTTIRDAQNLVVFEKSQPILANAFGPERASDFTIELPLSQFPVGNYVLTVEATAGAETVKRDSRFYVK